jgi:hypothetical protein
MSNRNLIMMKMSWPRSFSLNYEEIERFK